MITHHLHLEFLPTEDRFLDQHLADRRRIEAGLTDGLRAAEALPNVIDVRVLGAIGVLELDRPVDLRVATPAAVERGVWLRPFRNLIYVMPPYICTDAEIDQITSAMVGVARALT